ncbi:MAG: hypothetical protein AAF266_06695 [Planctomycetota bacterium]
MRPTVLALSVALVACYAQAADAQCCGTPAPTVAYSPVVAAPAAPVVQATTVSNGWYPGKYLTDFTRSLFGLNQTTTYTAGYAPVPYTAGYAPTYSVGYAPTPYTAGFAPTVQTAYRPTYPASFGPVVQSVSRPVVLSPVVSAPACNACNSCGACDACGGVEQAYYAAAPSAGCSSCNAGASFSAPIQSAAPSPSPAFGEPRPALGPLDNPASERSIQTQRPELNEFDSEFPEPEFNDNDSVPSDPAAANDYWGAPPLFAPPSNRVTRRTHPAPTQVAVYRQAPETRRTAYRPASEPATVAPKVHRLSADGWGSAE